MSGDDVALRKTEIRSAMRRKVLQLPEEEYRQGSTSICRIVGEMISWRRAKSVCVYFPSRQEPDVQPLFKTALMAGKKLFLPGFDERHGVYKAVEVEDPTRDLRPGRYGIPEPVARHGHPDAPDLIDFVLVPALAFSINGCRLGRGGGYFDRLLAQTRSEKCGVAFECQLTNELPVESHDIRMDCIVTPAGCLKCAP